MGKMAGTRPEPEDIPGLPLAGKGVVPHPAREPDMALAPGIPGPVADTAAAGTAVVDIVVVAAPFAVVAPQVLLGHGVQRN